MSEVNFLDHKTWEGVSAAAESDFLRGGEQLIKSTLTLGQGADLRATTMMGMFGTVAVALFAAAVTLFAGPHPSWPLIAGAATTAFGLFIAASFCAAAAWPREFYVAGFEPRNLIANSSAKNDQFRARVLIAVTQDRIDHNRRAIGRAACLLMAALWSAGISLLAGGLVVIALVLAGKSLA
jgi:hypothetical protein